jgi:formiminoglutamase
MWTEVDETVWQGRVDRDGEAGLRWHQAVRPLTADADITGQAVLLGFACDEGVRRNQGRVGAAVGPDSIRKAMANLAWDRPGEDALFEAGTIACEGEALEAAQQALGGRLAQILDRGGRAVVLGGGHEVAWGSYLGLQQAMGLKPGKLGILNFDAHFDLRDPAAGASSGTPFRQIAESCEAQSQAFHYFVLGINPAVNTPALFDYARRKNVAWFEDRQCVAANLPPMTAALESFVAGLDELYITICLDAFPAALAPGVSAPGVPGICPYTALDLLDVVKHSCAANNTRLRLLDIAEMNPLFDRDGITARWAARLVQHYLQ